ncbi:unnamed protein product, partial [Linum tenue]
MSLHSAVTTSEEVTDFVVHKANGLKGLVDSGLATTLPPQYIQPLAERLESIKISTSASIPIIDVSNLDDPSVQDSIFEAASKWGFFQIVNHGIPSQVLAKVIDAAHGFYGQSSSLSVSDTVFYGTSFSPQAEQVLEWKDFLMFQDQVLDYVRSSEPVMKKLVEVLLKKIGVNEMNKERERCLMGLPR